jgi:hypothetical protein
MFRKQETKQEFRLIYVYILSAGLLVELYPYWAKESGRDLYILIPHQSRSLIYMPPSSHEFFFDTKN